MYSLFHLVINISLLGALIVIFSLTISVFTQQAILSVPCSKPIPGQNVTLPIGSNTGQLPQYLYTANTWDMDPIMKINIINALSNHSANGSVSARGCTSVNCTFKSVNV